MSNNDTSFLSDRDLAFYEFVKYHHKGQKRKYTLEAYHLHPLSVARIVKPYEKDNVPLIPIALGHDLLEDTDVDIDDLYKMLENTYSEYGHFIYLGIRALTNQYTKENYPDYNRAKRKYLEALRMTSITPEYQTVKYADLIDNLSTIVEYDPRFAVTYLQEKDELLKFMNTGNFNL